MALKTFSVGEVLTASDLNEYAVNSKFARKTADESVTSSTTVQNDDHLFLSVSANAVYELTSLLFYDGATAADLKIVWSAPTGSSGKWALSRLSSGAAAVTDDVIGALDIVGGIGIPGALGAGSTTVAIIRGLLVVGSTAGTFRLTWAQNTADATATRILTDSYLCLRRVD